jgi:SAM-dependent methyltransferase
VSLWLHELAEAEHRILNPLTDEKLMLIGELSRVGPGDRVLDLACGKAELLCRWAQRFGTGGTGVDVSEVFLSAARARAAELGVADRVAFVPGDAGRYDAGPERYPVVSCVGATWIGGGLAGTVTLMRRALSPGGLLVVGEPYWVDPPPPQAHAALGTGPEEFTSLVGTLDRFAAAGVEPVEMVLADGDSWDRYAAAQWWTLTGWLRSNPDDPRRAQVREFLDGTRRAHVEYGRRYLGWGVFLLRVREDGSEPVPAGGVQAFA